jgi:hypothetical protein
MIDQESMNRIIGDFLEVNASMLEKREKSKFPKFIANIIWNNDRKKLLKNINTLRNSNYSLTMENISELSLYVFNNFDDKKYKSIFLVKVNKLLTYDNMEMVLKFDNITSIFDFNSNDNTFDVKIMEILDNDNRNNYNFTLHRLNNSTVPVIGKINEELKNILCDYIYDIISLYK